MDHRLSEYSHLLMGFSSETLERVSPSCFIFFSSYSHKESLQRFGCSVAIHFKITVETMVPIFYLVFLCEITLN